MTKRILPETLPAVYQTIDVMPEQNLYAVTENDGTRFACGLGVRCWELLGTAEGLAHMDSDEAARLLGLSGSYALGYQRGWDGDDRLLGSRWFAQTDYDLGYQDGAAGWAAVKDMAVTQ